MHTLLTPSNITFAIGIMGIIFGVYHFFKNPQIEEEKKSGLLEQQVKWEKEQNEKKFNEIGDRMDRALTLAQNHTHTVDVKVDTLIASVNDMKLSMSSDITKLFTILEERLPKK